MNTKTLVTVYTLFAAATLFAQDRASSSSPRSREQFPELSRVPQVYSVEASEQRLAAIKADAAYAASPRVREEFPALDRQFVTRTGDNRPVIENRALAASPRAKEEFPWLARETGPSPIEIAPVK